MSAGRRITTERIVELRRFEDGGGDIWSRRPYRRTGVFRVELRELCAPVMLVNGRTGEITWPGGPRRVVEL